MLPFLHGTVFDKILNKTSGVSRSGPVNFEKFDKENRTWGSESQLGAQLIKNLRKPTTQVFDFISRKIKT